jgi:ribonuclease I
MILRNLIAAVAMIAALVPAEHGDFGYYTFALTWQPGICSAQVGSLTGTGRPDACAADQPHAPLIGLHGLWASQPQSLVSANVPVQQWWSRGCDFYHRSDEPPALSDDLRAKLAVVMPHFRTSLLAHEYDKHVQCFGFDPTLFFTTELAMRQAVDDAAFGRYLVAHAGSTLAHADVVAAFEASFGTTDARSVQLQCSSDAAGGKELTQIYITIRASALAAFPSAASLTDTPIDQDTCPATFLVPAW